MTAQVGNSMSGWYSRKLDLRRKLFLAAAGWTLIAAAAQSPPVPPWQTAAGNKLAFDVASIRPSTGAFSSPVFPLDNSDAYRPTGGRFKADFPLLVYVQFAYKLRFDPEQMRAMLATLPKWVSNTRFAIDARVEGNPTKDQMRLMMQSLLADRFQLTVHFETKEASVFLLTLSKPGKMGPKLRLHADGPPCDPQSAPPGGMFPPICDATMLTSQNGVSKLGSRNNTMALLAEALSIGRLGRPVVIRLDSMSGSISPSSGPLNPTQLPLPTPRAPHSSKPSTISSA